MSGQVRGFDLNEFLSDWEPEGQALPWTLGDGGWVAEGEQGQGKAQDREPRLKPAASARATVCLHQVMSSEGLSTKLKVLYVPDYISREQ